MLEGLGGRIAAVVDGGPCRVGVESTVLDLSGGTPFLLRPGGVTAEAIEAVVGPIGARHHAGGGARSRRTLRSPGLLVSHYAPRLARPAACRRAWRRTRRCWRSARPCPGPALTFQLSADAATCREAAARLFEGLRWLDRDGARLGLRGIAVMAVPEARAGRGHQRPAAAGRGAAVTEFDVIVIGAGAAGLMCAAVAGQRGRRVLLLDHAAEPGRKILISGGGRCNFTNTQARAGAVLLRQPAFRPLRPGALHGGGFLRAGGPARHRQPREDARASCSATARRGRSWPCCWPNARRRGVDRAAGPPRDRARQIRRAFVVDTDRGAFTAASLVLATGGLSIPKLGATAFAYEAAQPVRPGADASGARPWCRSSPMTTIWH